VWLRSFRKLKVALSCIWSSTAWNYSKSKGATGRFEVKKPSICGTGEFTFSSTARKHTGKTRSTPRSSKSKSEHPPFKKAKHESGSNGCEGSSIELKEEEEEELEDGRSKATLPETRTEVVEDVKSSHSKPLGPAGAEEVELMDTSDGGGDGGEKEERKKDDSNSLAAEKKDGSGSGTIEPTKTKKPVHPFFGNADSCLITARVLYHNLWLVPVRM